MILKSNDVICYKNEIYVLIKEIHVNIIDDPVPHMGYTLAHLSGKRSNIVIIDNEYNLVEVLVRR